jgi:hypothetical protein
MKTLIESYYARLEQLKAGKPEIYKGERKNIEAILKKTIKAILEKKKK